MSPAPEASRPRLGEVHLITPGDHYSPRTGSAVPTVVHGLAAAAARTPVVLVAAGTYPDRYPSAAAVEYSMRAPRRRDRYVDAAAARAGLPRSGARASYRAALAPQGTLEPSVVLAHNAVQAIPEIDRGRHAPVLYAHNELLRSYGGREVQRVLGPGAGTVAVSEHLAARLADRLPRGSRVEVVRNGVDTDEFSPPERWERGDSVQVLFVGRTIPDKGVHVLLEALLRLGRGDVGLDVIGRHGFSADDRLTPYEQRLRSVGTQLAGPVRFRSFLPRADVVRALRECDVAVVPSTWPEPSGLTVLEGMASGAAVVASRIGGIPEQAGDAAFLVPPGDPAALAEALAHLADDEEALRTARKASREHALGRTWRHARADLDTAIGKLTG